MLEARRYREIAALHVEGIKDGFLSSLGVDVLALIYRAIDEADECVLIVEMDEDCVIGFVAGGAGMRPIYKRMLARFPQLVKALAPELLKPKKLRGLAEILTRRGSQDEGAADTNLPDAELFSIVVASANRGQGVADRLYVEFARQLAKRGFDAFKIMVGEDLQTAHSFYRRMGAVPKLTATFHKGAKSVLYVHRLPR
ncbi:GNAT family N-acetyltransferase [Roseicyclus sp. F158]|uniref:GNAT family N-acetyltransferase n=1 Tax=Tropicimonas omnivorans TaxID=3075590 RepID=A0ABU3DLB5_9RHOB|nr:GNAT family N-acetyltransferase [Roseicyclus sp. F158]MDT0684517.1 GNAT family N-acetyltransferase [Roseicyclus sp. F158]